MFVSSFVEGRYPAWWYNIKVNPQVMVELRDQTYGGTGRVLEGTEYDEFAGWVLVANPLLVDFQSRIGLCRWSCGLSMVRSERFLRSAGPGVSNDVYRAARQNQDAGGDRTRVMRAARPAVRTCHHHRCSRRRLAALLEEV